MRIKSPCGEAVVVLLSKDDKPRLQNSVFSSRFQVSAFHFHWDYDSNETFNLNVLGT